MIDSNCHAGAAEAADTAFGVAGPRGVPSITLVSHLLCPYVQRAAIVLAEKGIVFERHNIDLAHKPDWFLKISPLGKTPVLLVGDEAIFESAVICEYLDETAAPRLLPEDPLARARHRAWIEFGSSLLNAVGAFYNAPGENSLAACARDIRARFELLETALGAGPYFAGSDFSIVDAAFGPVFRYFEVFETIDDFGFFDGLPKMRSWGACLALRDSVRGAVSPDYGELLRAFLLRRPSALSMRMARKPALADSR